MINKNSYEINEQTNGLLVARQYLMQICKTNCLDGMLLMFFIDISHEYLL